MSHEDEKAMVLAAGCELTAIEPKKLELRLNTAWVVRLNQSDYASFCKYLDRLITAASQRGYSFSSWRDEASRQLVFEFLLREDTLAVEPSDAYKIKLAFDRAFFIPPGRF